MKPYDFLLVHVPAVLIGVALGLPPITAVPIGIAGYVAYLLGFYRGKREQSRKP